MSVFSISVVAETFDWTIYAEPDSVLWRGGKDVDDIETNIENKNFGERVFVLSSRSYFLDDMEDLKEVNFEIKLNDFLRSFPVFKNNIIETDIDDEWSAPSIEDINKVGDEVVLTYITDCRAIMTWWCEFRFKANFTYLKPSQFKGFASVSIKDKNKPLYGSTDLSNIQTLINNNNFLYQLGGKNQNKPVAIGSSNPKILIGFSPFEDELTNTGDVAEVHDYAYQSSFDVVYVCLDDDENGECDFVPAVADCGSVEKAYKGECCELDSVYFDEYRDDIDALCTKDINNNPVWLPLDYIGEIFELSDASVVADGSKFHVCGQKPAALLSTIVEQVSDDSFFVIERGVEKHTYYCFDEQIFECGGDLPFSSSNFFSTGEKFYAPGGSSAFPGDFVYCAQIEPPFDMTMWTPFFDNQMFNYTCYAAGFNFTGTRCCGEFDEENYEDPWDTNPESKTPGLCWKSKYIPDWEIFDDKNSLVYKGKNLSCDRDSTLVCLDPLFLNPLMDPAIPNFAALCTPQGWVKGDDFARLYYSTRKETAWSPTSKGCCLQTECWNGTDCVEEESSVFADDKFHYCLNGAWESGYTKSDWHASKVWFCELDSQCLVNPDFNSAITDPDDYWDDDNDDRPRCINEGDYILDNYCDNGNWTSRTKFIFDQLYYIADTSGSSFSIYCDSPEQSLLNLDDLDVSCKKNNIEFPCVNSVCVAKVGNKVLLGTSLNIPVDDSKSFLKALALDEDICESASNTFTQCENNPVWYNHGIESLIYSPDLIPSFTTIGFDFKNKFDAMKSYVDSLPLNDVLEADAYHFFKMPFFSRVFLSKTSNAEIFSFLEINKSAAEINYLGIDFQDLKFSETDCKKVFKFNFDKVNCEENPATSSHFYLTAYDYPELPRPTTSPLPPLTDYWRDLTAKLRLK